MVLLAFTVCRLWGPYRDPDQQGDKQVADPRGFHFIVFVVVVIVVVIHYKTNPTGGGGGGEDRSSSPPKSPKGDDQSAPPPLGEGQWKCQCMRCILINDGGDLRCDTCNARRDGGGGGGGMMTPFAVRGCTKDILSWRYIRIARGWGDQMIRVGYDV